MTYNFFHGAESYASLYHIGMLINFLLRENYRLSLYLILEYNLLWSFIYELNNPEMFNIVNGLLDPVINQYGLDDETLKLLMAYFENEEILVDVASQLFD